MFIINVGSIGNVFNVEDTLSLSEMMHSHCLYTVWFKLTVTVTELSVN